MFKHLTRMVFVSGLLVVPLVATSTPVLADPGDCPNDSKLIGLIEISADDVPGTWWRLTKDGLAEAGIVSDADLLATLNGWFGTSFSDLTDAVAMLLEPVRAYDKNGNDFVCAFSLRGTRAYIGDPNYTLYSFGTQDDKERGN